MKLASDKSTVTDYSVARPIRVDYVGVALLTLWAFLRKTREAGAGESASIFHGGVPKGYESGQIEDEILRSLNITPSEAQLFSHSLELALSTFGHDRTTLSRAIRARLGDRVAGWRNEEEWEMLRAAKIFYGQLEGFGLTSNRQRIRTINVCHYLITLARLCELSLDDAKKNPLLQFLYSEREIEWLRKHVDVAMKSDRFETLRDRYQGDNSFGRLAFGMMRWLRAMFEADLTLVLARFYRTSPAALAAQRQLRVRRVKDSLIVRKQEVDTVVNSDDDTALDRTDEAPAEQPVSQGSRRQDSGRPAVDGRASDLAEHMLSHVNPYDPWVELDEASPEELLSDTKVDEEAWRQDVAGAIRESRRPRFARFFRRLFPVKKKSRYR